MTMIKRAAALRSQTAPIILLAPVCGELSISRRKIAEHELAAIDIGCPGRPDRIHADREKGVSLGGDQPPSAVAPLGSEEASCTKAAASFQPAKVVALWRVGEPLFEFLPFLVTSGAQHLGRADFLCPIARTKLAESIDDPVICGPVCLARRRDAQGADSQTLGRCRTRDPQADRGNAGGV